MCLEKVQQQIGHFRADLPQNWAADIAVVSASAAGAVAAQAGGEDVAVRDGAAVHGKLCDAAADRAGAVKDIVYPGIIVVIVMLDLRLQKCIGDVEHPVRAPGKILRAALHRPAQNRAGDLQHRQRIRVRICVQNIPAPHGLRQSGCVVGKARDGDLRAACRQLHGIEQIRKQDSVCFHAQRRIRRHRRVQMSDDLIEPILCAALHL